MNRKKFLINRIEFGVLFTRLCLSKHYETDEVLNDLYWEDLKIFIGLKEALIKARTTHYFQGMPHISDLFSLARSLSEDKHNHLDNLERIKESEENDKIRLLENRRTGSRCRNSGIGTNTQYK